MLEATCNIDPDPNGEGRGGGFPVLRWDPILGDDVRCGIGPIEAEARYEER